MTYGRCPPGTYCTEGSEHPSFCAPGTYNAMAGETSAASCVGCDAGFYCPVRTPPLRERLRSPPMQLSAGGVLAAARGVPRGVCSQLRARRCALSGERDEPERCTAGQTALPAGLLLRPWLDHRHGDSCAPHHHRHPPRCFRRLRPPARSNAACGCRRTACPVGTYDAAGGRRNISECSPCPAGYGCPSVATVAPLPCHAGWYCAGNTTTVTPAGVGGDTCLVGHFCPNGTAAPQPCGAGEYCGASGLAAASGLCSAGYFCHSAATSPTPAEDPGGGLFGSCPVGHYCPAGECFVHAAHVDYRPTSWA